MFTGIVQEIGSVRRVEPRSGGKPVEQGGAQDCRLEICFARIARQRLGLGDSVCVDGVCLTVAELTADSFVADVSGETLRVTPPAAKQAGPRVNLEPRP